MKKIFIYSDWGVFNIFDIVLRLFSAAWRGCPDLSSSGIVEQRPNSWGWAAPVQYIGTQPVITNIPQKLVKTFPNPIVGEET